MIVGLPSIVSRPVLQVSQSRPDVRSGPPGILCESENTKNKKQKIPPDLTFSGGKTPDLASVLFWCFQKKSDFIGLFEKSGNLRIFGTIFGFFEKPWDSYLISEWERRNGKNLWNKSDDFYYRRCPQIFVIVLFFFGDSLEATLTEKEKNLPLVTWRVMFLS